MASGSSSPDTGVLDIIQPLATRDPRLTDAPPMKLQIETRFLAQNGITNNKKKQPNFTCVHKRSVLSKYAWVIYIYIYNIFIYTYIFLDTSWKMLFSVRVQWVTSRIWLSSGSLQPLVVEISSFLDEKDCQHIIDKALPHIEKSAVKHMDHEPWRWHFWSQLGLCRGD